MIIASKTIIIFMIIFLSRAFCCMNVKNTNFRLRNHYDFHRKYLQFANIVRITKLRQLQTTDARNCNLEIPYGKTKQAKYLEEVIVPVPKQFSEQENYENFSIRVEALKYPLAFKNRGQHLFDKNEAQIIIGNSPQLFHSYFSNVNFSTKLTAKARQLHLLYFTSSAIAESTSIGVLLIYLWRKFRMLNVVAQSPCNPQFQDTIIMYKPFEIGSESNYGRILLYQLNDILRDVNLAYNNVENLNKYPIIVSIFNRYPTAIKQAPKVLKDSNIYKNIPTTSKYYGSDGMILSELAYFMNFSIRFLPLAKANFDYGTVKANGIAEGTLGEIIRREIELQVNARYFVDYGIFSFEYTTLFDFDQICVLVPKSEEIPKWVKIYNLFRPNLTFLVICTFLICTVVNRIMQERRDATLIDSFLEMYCIALGLSRDSIIYSNSHLSRRILLGSSMFFFIIITTLLTANMFQAFSTTIYLPEIDSLRELDRSNLTFKSSFNIFTTSSRRLYQRLAKKVNNSQLNITALDLVIQTRKYGGFERKKDAILKIQTDYTAKDGTPLIHIVSECPTEKFMGYIVPLGSPYLPIINLAIQRFKELGFHMKWYNDFAHAFIVRARMRNDRGQKDIFKPFTLEDIQSAFYVLLMGNLIGFVVFVVEVLWYHCYFSTTKETHWGYLA